MTVVGDKDLRDVLEYIKENVTDPINEQLNGDGGESTGLAEDVTKLKNTVYGDDTQDGLAETVDGKISKPSQSVGTDTQPIKVDADGVFTQVSAALATQSSVDEKISKPTDDVGDDTHPVKWVGKDGEFVAVGDELAKASDIPDTSGFVQTSDLADKVTEAGFIKEVPLASDSVNGGFQTGFTSTANNRAVLLDSNNKAYVNIPDATDEQSGLMTAADKATLDELAGNYSFDPELNNNSYEQVSKASGLGLGPSLWSIGAMLAVTLSGNMGNRVLSGTYYIFIVGFSHNSALEGNNLIHFQGFKSEDETDIALVGVTYSSSNSSGSLDYFNMNHWGNYNRGGWKDCDLRYDILGSTDNAQSDYGSARSTPSTTADNTGRNPSATCATSPVDNTLMSCLPEALRKVLKPVVKYTDSIGNNTGNVESNISMSVDYLPLLGECELWGELSSPYANSYEQNYQVQYTYYENGNSKIKNRHDTLAACYWWLRSPYYNYAASFCYVITSGGRNYHGAYYSYGVAPLLFI